jgi:predicted nuclease of restriction endonuclease-like RecB superfamily
LLPEAWLPFSLHGDLVVPQFLGEHDHPWVRALLDEHARFAGRPRRELDARLREPLSWTSPPAKRRAAIHVLARRCAAQNAAAVPPRAARTAVFLAAARSGTGREAVLAEVAAGLGVAPAELSHALFADLPGERLVTVPAEISSPGDLVLRVNLAIAQTLLFRSTAVAIDLDGNARAVVRHAKLRGLICTVASPDPTRGATVEISGPFALFRRTLLYGRALAELVPLIAWCPRFRLRGECVLRGRSLVVELAPRDPILPAREPRRYDSALEERFAREFQQLAPEWDVIREPEPVAAGEGLVFPDFALVRRRDGRRWLLEIVGFWTRRYLELKLARLRAAHLANLVLCIDEARNCGLEELPRGARVVSFRRRIDPQAVLSVIAQAT